MGSQSLRLTIGIVFVVCLHAICAEENDALNRSARSLGLKKLNFLPSFGLFGKEAEKAPVNVAVPVQIVPPPVTGGPREFPIWKIHKYNGIQLKPVPLASIPYIPVSVQPKPRPQLPSFDQIKDLLGTSSIAETLAVIRQFASTRDGLRMMAGYIKAQLGNPQITDEEVKSMIWNYEYSSSTDEVGYLPESNGAILQQYGAPHNYSPVPPPSTYGPPRRYGPPPPYYPPSKPSPTYGPPKNYPQPHKNVPSPPQYIPTSPIKHYGVPNAQWTLTASSNNKKSGGLSEESGSDFSDSFSRDKNHDVISVHSDGSGIRAPVLKYGPPRKVYGAPKEQYRPAKQTFVSSDEGSSSGNIVPSKMMIHIIESQNHDSHEFSHERQEEHISAFSDERLSQSYGAPSKKYVTPISISKPTAIVSDGDIAQEFIVPSSEENSDSFVEQVPAKEYNAPKNYATSTGVAESKFDEPQEFILPSEEQKDSFTIQTPLNNYGGPKLQSQSSGSDSPQEFILPSEELMDSFNVDENKGHVIPAPLQQYAPSNEIISHSQGGFSEESNLSGEQLIHDQIAAPAQTYSAPPLQQYNPQSQYAAPIAREGNFISVFQPEPFPAPLVYQYGSPKVEPINPAYSYPGYEPVAINQEVQKAISGLYIPFPVLPELPSLPEAQNLAHIQLSQSYQVADNDEASLANSANFASEPVHTQQFQQGFLPTDDNQYMYAVQQSSLDTGLTADSGAKITNVDTLENGRPVVSTTYEQPGFSYTQLGKIPLDESAPFKQSAGQISSYGDQISSHIFQYDNQASASELEPTVVIGNKKSSDRLNFFETKQKADVKQKPEHPLKVGNDNNKADHDHKPVEQKQKTEQKPAQTEKNQRPRWTPKSRRKYVGASSQDTPTSVVYPVTTPKMKTENKNSEKLHP